MSIIASSYKNTSPERVFSFQTITRNKKSDLNSLTLLDWISSNDVISLEGQTTSNVSSKAYQEVSFSLSETSADYFPLLRGILASDQPHLFSLQANNKLKSFILKYDIALEAEAKNYLSKVLDIIKAEARFKQVLRKVIINQEKYNREEKLLFMELSK